MQGSRCVHDNKPEGHLITKPMQKLDNMKKRSIRGPTNRKDEK